MKTREVTEQLNNSTLICLMAGTTEVARFRNFELPQVFAEAEMDDFHFNVHMDGKVTFEIHYALDALPAAY